MIYERYNIQLECLHVGLRTKLDPSVALNCTSALREKTAFAVLKKSMFANAVAAFHFGNFLEQWFVKSHKEQQSKQTTEHFCQYSYSRFLPVVH